MTSHTEDTKLTQHIVSEETPSCTVTLHVIDHVSAFDAIEGEWQKLVDQTQATVFQSFEWQRTWWKHYGEGNAHASLHILLMRCKNELVGIAPFFIESIELFGITDLRKLVFIGREISDYLDLILAEKCKQECIATIASYLASQDSLFDVVHLVDMPERTGHHHLLHQELMKRGLTGDLFVNEYCPQRSLEGSWEKTLASLPSNKRSTLKRSQRKVESDFNVALQITDQVHTLYPDFNEFIELHQKRWNESGQLGVFASRRAAAFHREFARIAFARRWLFLAFLTLNGRRVAANYGFMYKGQFFYYLSGIQMHGELAKYSLGRILHLYSILEAIRRGVKRYDFMRGTERYKYDFNSVDAENWTVIMFKDNKRRSKLKFKSALLLKSFHRRVAQERFLLKHAAEESIRSVPRLIIRRLITNLMDAAQKLRAPEKSVSLVREGSSPASLKTVNRN